MSERQETITDIIAELRHNSRGLMFYFRNEENGSTHAMGVDYIELADRLEAAHKRELSKNASKNGADFGQLGDCAKLREALKRIVAASIVAKNANAPEWILQRMADIFAMATTALAAPPRNCDVGTAEEQDERFHRFCVMQRKGSCAGCPDPVGGRTVANGVRECALIWAQMPYEEGGAA